MQIAIIQNNTVTQVGDYRILFPNTSFNANGPDDEWLTENSCLKVNLYLDHDPLTQKLQSCQPTISNGMVNLVEVVAMTADEITNQKASAMANIRAQRNALMNACDWTQTPDNPMINKSAWATYRQALRDIPEKMGSADPRTWSSWPTSPAEPTVSNLSTTGISSIPTSGV